MLVDEENQYDNGTKTTKDKRQRKKDNSSMSMPLVFHERA